MPLNPFHASRYPNIITDVLFARGPLICFNVERERPSRTLKPEHTTDEDRSLERTLIGLVYSAIGT